MKRNTFENFVPSSDCKARYLKYSVIFEKNDSGISQILDFDEVILKNSYKFVGSCFYKLKTSDSWRGRKDADCTFSKEEKEALNAIIFFILLIKKHKEEGMAFNQNTCIAYVLKRMIRKACTWDAKPENMEYIRNHITDYDVSETNFVHEQFVKSSNKSFVDFLDVLASQISAKERELFSVAKNYANLIEFDQIKDIIFEEDVSKVRDRLHRDADNHNTETFFNELLKSLITRISWSRNIVRWQGYGATLHCNILCHMYETAVFAWMMALEENYVFGGLKYDPAIAFMVGLFHDIPEIWTDDVPSPCKDGIFNNGVALRKLLSEQEKEALDKNFYTVFKNPNVVSYFKQNVMLEEIEDESFHKFMKKADYFSADYEVYWNIVVGLRHYRFLEILKNSNIPERRTSHQVELLTEWIEKIERNEFLEP